MLVKKALLVLSCGSCVVTTVGCSTPNRPAGRPSHTHFRDTNYAHDSFDNALAELVIALDRFGGDAVERRAEDQLVRRYAGGRSLENRLLECFVLGQGRDVTLILATIHGNEAAGTPLVLQLTEYLRQHPLMLRGHKVVLAPVVNPDGRAHNQRFNSHRVDLNRSFRPVSQQNGQQFGRTELSEPESRFIRMLIQQYKPDRIVSIHQPRSCIDYDGPAKGLATSMAEYCGLPVRKLGTRRGSLGSCAGETLGIPIVTFELPREAGKLDPESLWARYGNALVAAVLYPDLAK